MWLLTADSEAPTPPEGRALTVDRGDRASVQVHALSRWQATSAL